MSLADFQLESSGSENIFDKNKNDKLSSSGGHTAVLQAVSVDCRSRYVVVGGGGSLSQYRD